MKLSSIQAPLWHVTTRETGTIPALSNHSTSSDGATPYRKFYTSDYILDEAVTGCRRRTGSHKLAVELGTMIFASESFALLKVDAEVLTESWELFKQRREIPLSLTDCTSAVLARRHGIADIFTYDSDFRALGFVALSKVASD